MINNLGGGGGGVRKRHTQKKIRALKDTHSVQSSLDQRWNHDLKLNLVLSKYLIWTCAMSYTMYLTKVKKQQIHEKLRNE